MSSKRHILKSMNETFPTLESLELSVRSRNALRNLGITSLEELVQKTERDLLRVPNMGVKSLREIKMMLDSQGLSLGMKNVECLNASNDCQDDVLLSNARELSREDFNSQFFLLEIDLTKFPVRAKKSFKKMGIHFVFELTHKTKSELLKITSLGQGTIHKVEDELRRNGLCLGMDLSPDSLTFRELLNEKVLNIPNSSCIFENIDKFLEYEFLLQENNFQGLNIKGGELDAYYSSENFDTVISELINLVYQELTPLEQNIASKRIFFSGSVATLEQLGSAQKVTRERIRQIEKSIFETITLTFSLALPYLESSIKRMNIRMIDPYSVLDLSRSFFHNRETFIHFFRDLLPSDELFGNFLESEESIINKLRIDLLLTFAMPITKNTVANRLVEVYGFSPIQAEVFIKEKIFEISCVEGEKIIIEPPNKYLGVANVSLGYPNGIPWLDLSLIAKRLFSKCKNIRIDPCPDQSITHNSNVYLYGRGTYRNIIFYDIPIEKEIQIERAVFEYVNHMEDSIISLIQVKNDLNIDVNLYDLLYFLKEKSNKFHLQTSAGRMLLLKSDKLQAVGYDAKQVMLSYFEKKQEPQTIFQLKDCLTSRSEGHASFVVSQLLMDGLIIRIDDARYLPVSMIDKEILKSVKHKIKTFISNTDKIIAGSTLKDNVEDASGVIYHKLFYTSVALIVCKENGFYWTRHLCSQKFMPRDFSLVKYFSEKESDFKHLKFHEFKHLVSQSILIDDDGLRDIYSRHVSSKVNSSAA